MDSSDDLASRLTLLGAQLTPPAGDDVTLVALLPCEPVVGEVAVACWADADGGEAFELYRLDDARALHDHTALRESLTLLAMTETLEELASFHTLGGIVDQLVAWRDRAGDVSSMAVQLDRASAALISLHTLGPGEGPRVARTRLLDALGASLRELDTAWAALEIAGEAWCDTYIAEHGERDVAAIELVQDLWRALGAGRRGPLARPASGALHAGREAGTAMASAIAEAMRAQVDAKPNTEG